MFIDAIESMLWEKRNEGNENWRDFPTKILATLGLLHAYKTPLEKVVKILRPLGPKMEDEGRIGSSLAAYVRKRSGGGGDNPNQTEKLRELHSLVEEVLELDEDDEREGSLSTQSVESREREERGVERTGG